MFQLILFQFNYPVQQLYTKQYYQPTQSHHSQPFQGIYEKYLDDVMQMCHAEEARLQKSMYDLRKVRRYWRDIDFDDKENEEEGYSNGKYNSRNMRGNSRSYRRNMGDC